MLSNRIIPDAPALPLHSQPNNAQNEQAGNPNAYHSESHRDFGVCYGPALRDYVSNRERRYREGEREGQVFESGGHRLEGPKDSTKDDHRIEASRGHETRRDVRVTEDGNQEAVQHSSEAQENKQTGNSQSVAFVGGVEEVGGVSDHLETLDEHHDSLDAHVGNQKFRDCDSSDQSSVPDSLQFVRDE